MSGTKKQSTEAAVHEIRRRTRRKFSPEEKIRIVLEGLRGEQSVAGVGEEDARMRVTGSWFTESLGQDLPKTQLERPIYDRDRTSIRRRPAA